MANTTNTYDAEKTKTITLNLPVRMYYQTEMTYDLFRDNYFGDKAEGESEEDYELRCARTWAKLTKTLGSEHELEEVEGDLNEDEDALGWGDAEAEFEACVAQVAKKVKTEMKKEAVVPTILDG